MSENKPQKNRYQQGVGHVSKSGKSVLVVSKNGTTYYTKLNQIKKVKRTPEEKGLWLNRKGDISTRVKPICSDSDSPAYMRYWDKKLQLRNQYPKWVHMSREQCREYYSKIWDLMITDEDYLQWKEETKTLAERNEDLWWDEQKEREQNYNGRNDEYDW